MANRVAPSGPPLEQRSTQDWCAACFLGANVGRVCDAPLDHRNPGLVPAAWTQSSGSAWLFAARSPMKSPFQRDRTGRNGSGVASLRPRERAGGRTRPRDLPTSRESPGAGGGLGCSLKLGKASRAQVSGGNGSAKPIKTKKGPKGHPGKDTLCPPPRLLPLGLGTHRGFASPPHALALPGSLVLHHQILRVLS